MFLRLASLLAVALAPAAGAVTSEAHQTTATTAAIVLTWPSPVGFATSTDGRELLLRFERPLDLTGSPALDTVLPDWIEAATTGFDTLLVRAARDVTYVLRREGAAVVIEMTALARPAAAPPVADDAERRLNLLRAQFWVREGRWTRADRLLKAEAAEAPDTTAREMRRQLRSDHGARARVDMDLKHVGSAQAERVARVSTHAFVAGYLRIGGIAESNQATLGGRSFQRQRSELFVQQDFDAGSELRASAFGTPSSVGGGLSFAQPDGSGRTQVQVEYRRPFWEFVEGLVDQGTRDRAEIRREQRFGSFLSARAGAAFNRYGLGGIQEAARSAALDGGVTATLRQDRPRLAAEYGLDIESRLSAVPGTLPLVSREVHAGSGTVQYRLWSAVWFDATAGYAIDRLGGRGPFTAARLRRAGPGRLLFDVWFDRRLNSTSTGQVVSRAGASVAWRFN